jgi:hypothetical protein
MESGRIVATSGLWEFSIARAVVIGCSGGTTEAEVSNRCKSVPLICENLCNNFSFAYSSKELTTCEPVRPILLSEHRS